MQRRSFLQKSFLVGIATTTLPNLLHSHHFRPEITTSSFFKLSLAQWSLHRTFMKKELDVYDFAEKAKEMGFEGLEYVSQLYRDVMNASDKKGAMKKFISLSNSKAEEHGVENLLIMIDGEGDLAVPNKKERLTAIENHKQWVEAAAEMNCHSIRINLFGEKSEEAWKDQAGEAMRKLGEFAQGHNINVIVENHGYLSSNAQLVMEMLAEVNLDNCGTLPDFGNFCLEREKGKRWEADCIKEYDRYKGVEELMSKAFAVSAKSYDFDAQGNETTIDYGKMLSLVKNAGYNGYIGVEYEGSRLSEIDGILATKNLLLNAATKMN